MSEQIAAVNEVNEEQAPVVVEVKKGKPAPSDKTVIKNLRAELKKLKEELEAKDQELDTAKHKAEHYFRTSEAAKKELAVTYERFSQASEILFQSIQAGLNAFNMTRRK